MTNDTTANPRIRMHEIAGEHRLFLAFVHANVAVYLTESEVHRLAHDLMDWSMWLQDQKSTV